jgi:hypothetical protein
VIGWVLGLGAAALLAYEGWKRWTGSATPAPPSGPPGAPGVTDPNAPRADFEHPPRFLASPMHMLQGQRYRFRYRDGSFVPGSMFGNVRLYASESELPADWPVETKGAQSTSTRFAAGVWGSPTAENVDKPDGLLQVWPTMSTA